MPRPPASRVPIVPPLPPWLMIGTRPPVPPWLHAAWVNARPMPATKTLARAVDFLHIGLVEPASYLLLISRTLAARALPADLLFRHAIRGAIGAPLHRSPQVSLGHPSTGRSVDRNHMPHRIGNRQCHHHNGAPRCIPSCIRRTCCRCLVPRTPLGPGWLHHHSHIPLRFRQCHHHNGVCFPHLDPHHHAHCSAELICRTQVRPCRLREELRWLRRF